jgi:ATP-dependent RNA helicase RhlE
MLFSELGLSEQLLKAVADQGYQTPTPIQAQAIPVILQGRDVLAGAQTGTGKTAGFTLPLLQLLQQKPIPQKPRPVRVLILTPTRELAMQVYESVRTYGAHLPFFAEAIFGGVSINPQIQKMQRGTDIIVATPGRLLDLIHQRHIDLSRVEYFVLDEADRMLDMGFIRDIRKIIDLLPKKRQNLLFSATYAPEISALAEQILNDPVEISVAKRNAAADTVSQLVYGIKREFKRELLSYLIGNGNWHQVLVFVRTKHGADRLCKQLIHDGIRCAALHGDKSQGARVRALEDFKNGTITALIATDIAARGLDIDQLPHVVNFDLPQVAEDYVHRIGRTGRAGADGQAISLVEPDEAYLLAAIEKLLKREIPRVADTGYEKVSLDVVNSKPKPKPQQTKPARRPQGAGRSPASGNRAAPSGKSSQQRSRTR